MTEFLYSLRLDSDFISEESPNYKLDAWPPHGDTPVTCDSNNNIVSIFNDNIWDFTAYCNKNVKFNFGDESQKKGYIIDCKNIYLFKVIAAYWLWGAGSVKTIQNLMVKLAKLKPLIYVCSKNNILISDLNNHDYVLEEIASIYKSQTSRLLNLLKNLYADSSEIGFVLLDYNSIKKLSKYFDEDYVTQTPYIPYRIWSYQILRFEECLKDFLNHKNEIKHLFNSMMDIYQSRSYKRSNRKKFLKYIQELNLSNVFEKWVEIDSSGISIRNLSRYLSLISFSAIAYIVNYSLMRIDEASQLKYGCFIDKEINNEKYYFIQGETNKTIKDKEALWIVPSIVSIAIEAISIICELRFSVLQKNGFISQSIEEFRPYLHLNSFEPWASSANDFEKISLINEVRRYNEALHMWPKLFDHNQLVIQEEDLKIARKMTSYLDETKFRVGNIWPLAWHQLRRTGAVNMSASDLVQDESLQYQLKHSSKFMSLYYASNAYKLNFDLNEEVGELFMQEWHMHNVSKNQELVSENFISPHGSKRKAQLISTITLKDHTSLLSLSKSKKLNYRETFLGGCTKSGDPCPYGGITNISMCMGIDGNPPCDSVLLDKNKLPFMYQLEDFYQKKFNNHETDSIPAKATLQQLISVRKAINVIKSNETE